ncbi:hypothetical protein BCR35DRAFT_5 [Leucosporidium creatinivorum]|uniref:RING-type domain-containing protein n=1 Tax=Leucosporidium creatinivorum TaxID=106004 RepID=A0A1Y2G5P8_9BASI|nr:hypothetical protein BCR35DRAFT_5 [Leucosporidium creatinivorum]
MRVELNRGWQRSNNAFNTAALAQLRALGGATPGDDASSTESKGKAVPTPAKKATGPVASVTDCCICLYPVTVCQALFIAPCSHVTHFKCIRPLITQNYPGFCCPLCRTYADLEADVEIEPWEPEEPVAAEAPATVDEAPELQEDDAMSSRQWCRQQSCAPSPHAFRPRSISPFLPSRRTSRFSYLRLAQHLSSHLHQHLQQPRTSH